jgi:hypothetical protein
MLRASMARLREYLDNHRQDLKAKTEPLTEHEQGQIFIAALTSTWIQRALTEAEDDDTNSPDRMQASRL